jgi:hypothetical protein
MRRSITFSVNHEWLVNQDEHCRAKRSYRLGVCPGGARVFNPFSSLRIDLVDHDVIGNRVENRVAIFIEPIEVFGHVQNERARWIVVMNRIFSISQLEERITGIRIATRECELEVLLADHRLWDNPGVNHTASSWSFRWSRILAHAVSLLG